MNTTGPKDYIEIMLETCAIHYPNICETHEALIFQRGYN